MKLTFALLVLLIGSRALSASSIQMCLEAYGNEDVDMVFMERADQERATVKEIGNEYLLKLANDAADRGRASLIIERPRALDTSWDYTPELRALERSGYHYAVDTFTNLHGLDYQKLADTNTATDRFEIELRGSRELSKRLEAEMMNTRKLAASYLYDLAIIATKSGNLRFRVSRTSKPGLNAGAVALNVSGVTDEVMRFSREYNVAGLRLPDTKNESEIFEIDLRGSKTFEDIYAKDRANLFNLSETFFEGLIIKAAASGKKQLMFTIQKKRSLTDGTSDMHRAYRVIGPKAALIKYCELHGFPIKALPDVGDAYERYNVDFTSFTVQRFAK